MKKIYTSIVVLVSLLLQYTNAQTGSVNLIPPNGTTTTYASIGAAYAAILTPLTGNYLIEFTSAYSGASETYPIQLTDKGLLAGGNTITIRPAAGNNSTIIQPPAPAAGAIIQFNGADNVILDGRPGGITSASASYLTINDTYSGGNANRNIELFNGANNNIIRFINSSAAAATSDGGGSRNILIGNGSATAGNNNNTVTNCIVNGGLRGIQDYGASTAISNNGNIISNNRVGSFGDIGIFAGYYQTNITIQNNYVALNSYDRPVPASISGIQQQSSSGTATIANNIISLVSTSTTATGIFGIADVGTGTENIRGNNIIALSLPATPGNKPIYGIFLATLPVTGTTVYNVSQNKISGLTSTGPVNIRGIAAFPFTGSTLNINNNFVSITDNNALATVIFGILIGNSGAGYNYTTNLYHNSIRIGGAQAAANKGSAFGIFKGDQNTGSIYNQRNNISIMERSGGYPDSSRFIGFLLGNTAGTNTVNYNTYYATDATNGFAASGWNGLQYRNATLANYKTAAGTQEQNTNFSNVSFVSNTDLHLSPSPGTATIFYGTPIAGITIDVDSNTRSATRPFQGADEPGGLIPALLLTLTGEKYDTYNTLRWQTVIEQNNRGFYVERSIDGRTFTSLQFVSSKAVGGNSILGLSYTFDDTKPLISKGFYRLRQVSIDGRETYSNTITIAGKTPMALSVASFYPNPVTTSLHLVVKTTANAKAAITMIDAIGRIVMQQNTFLTTGDNYLSVSTTLLPSGAYTLVLRDIANNETVTIHLVK